MWNFFRRKQPQQSPEQQEFLRWLHTRAAPTPIPEAEKSPIRDDEINKLRVSIGYHIRMTANGGMVADHIAQNYALTCALLTVELLARIDEKIDGLREDMEVDRRVKAAPAWPQSS